MKISTTGLDEFASEVTGHPTEVRLLSEPAGWTIGGQVTWDAQKHVYVIRLQRELLQPSAPKAALRHVFFHECAHIRLGHVSKRAANHIDSGAAWEPTAKQTAARDAAYATQAVKARELSADVLGAVLDGLYRDRDLFSLALA